MGSRGRSRGLCSSDADGSDHFAAAQPTDADKTAHAPQNGTDGQVALLMAPLQISSVSELADKDIAIDDKISASSAGIRAAMMAAGAAQAQAQLSEGRCEAINMLVSGEVAAAVFALASPEAAE